jgi:hypothetical protein
MMHQKTKSTKKTKRGKAIKDLRIVVNTIDAANRVKPFLIIEFTNEEDYKEFWRISGDGKAVFLADRLEGRKIFIPDGLGGYELKFPPYFNEYGRRNLFWYNHFYETYRKAFERLTEKKAEALSEFFSKDEEEALWEEARMRAEEVLENLAVIKI